MSSIIAIVASVIFVIVVIMLAYIQLQIVDVLRNLQNERGHQVRVAPPRSIDESRLVPLEEKLYKAVDRISRLEATSVGLATQVRSVAAALSIASVDRKNVAEMSYALGQPPATDLVAKVDAIEVKTEGYRKHLNEVATMLELIRQDMAHVVVRPVERSAAAPAETGAMRAAQEAGSETEGRFSAIDHVVEEWNRAFVGGAELCDEALLRVQRRTGWSYTVFPHNTDLVICYRRRSNAQPVATVLPRIGSMALYGEHYFERARDSGPKAKVIRVLRHATLRPLEEDNFRDLLEGKGPFSDMGSVRVYVQDKGEVDVGV